MLGSVPIKPFVKLRTLNNILFIRKETGLSVIDFLKLVDQSELKDEILYIRRELSEAAVTYVESITRISEKVASRYSDIIRGPAEFIHLVINLAVPFSSLLVSTLTSQVVFGVQGLLENLGKNSVNDVVNSIVDDLVAKYFMMMVNDEPLIATTVTKAYNQLYGDSTSQRVIQPPLLVDSVEVLDTPSLTIAFHEIREDVKETINTNIVQLINTGSPDDTIENGLKESEKYANKHYLYKLSVVAGLLEKMITDLAIGTCKTYRGNKLRECIDNTISYIMAAVTITLDQNRDAIVSRLAREIEKHFTTM